MKRIVVLCLALFVSGSSLAWADRGSIPFQPGVKIFEPRQRAVIGFNGEQEILLLSTDLRATQKTKVLEVMPFPNEPTVKRGSVNLIEQLTEQIEAASQEVYMPSGVHGGWGGQTFSAGSVPPGRVASHQVIGAHDIHVVEVLSPDGFVTWVETYFRSSGADMPEISSSMIAIVREYLRDAYKWFVFDVVELGTEVVTNDAIQYRFATTSLYYPMRISRDEHGETSIGLVILSPQMPFRIARPQSFQIRRSDGGLFLSKEALRTKDSELATIFADAASIIARIWYIQGDISKIAEDLNANIGDGDGREAMADYIWEHQLRSNYDHSAWIPVWWTRGDREPSLAEAAGSWSTEPRLPMGPYRPDAFPAGNKEQPVQWIWIWTIKDWKWQLTPVRVSRDMLWQPIPRW